MVKNMDLYLGTFLILCGFSLSILNLRRVMRRSQRTISSVLLSENILLMCIGVAFVSRSVYELNSASISMDEIEERTADLKKLGKIDQTSLHCGFFSVLMSYGPLIVSLVNSFLSLIIDNYMHYKMLNDLKEKDEENIVRQIGEETRTERKINFNKIFDISKRYLSYVLIVLQWIIPITIAMLMYPMGANPKLGIGEERSTADTCITMLDFALERCSNLTVNSTFYTLPIKYLEVYEYENKNANDTRNIDTILNNVFNVLSNYNNETDFLFTNELRSQRRPKMDGVCTKICYMDNNNLLLYMFLLVIVSYFVPISISMVILTKIHVMEIKKTGMKTYVTRELLYNILFWTPVMFDTFLSLMFCSYSMDGMRTSLFNVIANIYQTVKNFMNTKYFKENAVVPV